MYGYYGNTGGYYVQNTIVSLEFNMYETKNKKLIWALTTETVQPENINKDVKNLSEIIVKELKKENLL